MRVIGRCVKGVLRGILRTSSIEGLILDDMKAAKKQTLNLYCLRRIITNTKSLERETKAVST